MSSSVPENPPPVTAKVSLAGGDDTLVLYLNTFEVAANPNELSVYGARLPTKPTPEMLEGLAAGLIEYEASIQIIMPLRVVDEVISALRQQLDTQLHFASNKP
ncbi:MAG: hypothetical protein NVS1B6_18350 [Steroidobacteraceae bacterium]